jgi:hypothetical protein
VTGRILVLNTGSSSIKLALFSDQVGLDPTVVSPAAISAVGKRLERIFRPVALSDRVSRTGFTRAKAPFPSRCRRCRETLISDRPRQCGRGGKVAAGNTTVDTGGSTPTGSVAASSVIGLSFPRGSVAGQRDRDH